MNDELKFIYGIQFLSAQQQFKYYIITKHKDKVSKRLLDEAQAIKQSAIETGFRAWTEQALDADHNPLYNLIKNTK